MKNFPVVNGSAVLGGKNLAFSYINDKGEINVFSSRRKNNFWGINVPFIRAFSTLIFGIYVFLISLKTNNVFEEKEEKNLKYLNKNKKTVFLLTIFGLFFAFSFFVGLFIVPYVVYFSLEKSGTNRFLIAFILGLVRVGFFILSLLCLKVVPSVRQFYRENGANNLAIANSNNKKLDSYHLSTNFLNYIVTSFLISVFVLSFVVVNLAFIYKFLLNLLLILIVFSLTYEFLKLLEFKNNLFSKLIVFPISFLVTEKPTQTEKEIAFSAVSEVSLMKENNERIIEEVKGSSIPFSVVYSEVKQQLSSVGISDQSEVDWLIAMALKKNRSEIKLLSHVSKEEYKKIKSALLKREKRMPISKIFNVANFYGRDFYVDKNVLSPRQETELVVEEAIKEIKKFEKAKVLDLMTGSGAIATTLALETEASVFASDVSKTALEIAKRNAKDLGAKIKFFESDIFKGLKKEKFDVIVSNPPYIPTKEILTLDDEVKKFDPMLALDGGEDGLFFYRQIAEQSPEFLKANGVLVLEIGFDQGESVKKLLQKTFKNIRIKKDYSGNDRIVVATKK